jgi:hypothetical protein
VGFVTLYVDFFGRIRYSSNAPDILGLVFEHFETRADNVTEVMLELSQRYSPPSARCSWFRICIERDAVSCCLLGCDVV